MTNSWIDDFARKMSAELSTALKLSGDLANKLNQDFIARIGRLNALCAKIGLLALCGSAIGIIDIRHIIALFAEPTKEAILGALAVLFAFSSFGVGLLLAASLHRGFILSKRSAAN